VGVTIVTKCTGGIKGGEAHSNLLKSGVRAQMGKKRTKDDQHKLQSKEEC